jgi:hypothetical protein
MSIYRGKIEAEQEAEQFKDMHRCVCGRLKAYRPRGRVAGAPLPSKAEIARILGVPIGETPMEETTEETPAPLFFQPGFLPGRGREIPTLADEVPLPSKEEIAGILETPIGKTPLEGTADTPDVLPSDTSDLSYFRLGWPGSVLCGGREVFIPGAPPELCNDCLDTLASRIRNLSSSGKYGVHFDQPARTKLLCAVLGHKWDKCICRRCGASKHTWKGCICTECGSVDHQWVVINTSFEPCSRCNGSGSYLNTRTNHPGGLWQTCPDCGNNRGRYTTYSCCAVCLTIESS